MAARAKKVALSSQGAWCMSQLESRSQTKNIRGIEGAFPTVPRNGKLFTTSLITEYYLQTTWSRNWSLTHRKLYHPSNSPAYGAFEQSTDCSFLCLQSKTGVLTWAKYSVHTLVWLGSADHEPCQLWVPSCCFARGGKLIHSHTYSWAYYPV